MNEELLQFTRHALEHKVARSEIGVVLAKAGWTEPDIRGALAAYANVDFPIPVPRPEPYLSAREVFMYIVMFSALFDSCFNLGSIIFSAIDKTWPDAATNMGYMANYFRDSVRWEVSHLVISFPLFLFLFNATNKAIALNPIRHSSKPRKWLTYITLMIATLALTCDLGSLVYNVLGGELTIRFVMKTLTVATIAGSVFTYFFQDVRKGENI